MSDPKILASARHSAGGSQKDMVDSERSWAALGWIGLTFLVVGGADFVLLWIPPSFGSREWEFGTATQSLNGMPVLLLGIGLVTVAAEQTGRRWLGAVAAVACAVLILWVLVGVALWASNAGLALSTVPTELRPGIWKALVKTAIQSAAYPVVLGYLLRRAWVGLSGSAGNA